VCCSLLLQCVAVCCSVSHLQLFKPYSHTPLFFLQLLLPLAFFTATHSHSHSHSTLKHKAPHFQPTTSHYSFRFKTWRLKRHTPLSHKHTHTYTHTHTHTQQQSTTFNISKNKRRRRCACQTQVRRQTRPHRCVGCQKVVYPVLQEYRENIFTPYPPESRHRCA